MSIHLGAIALGSSRHSRAVTALLPKKPLLDDLPTDRVFITLPLMSNLANVGTQISEFVRFLLPDWDCQSRIVKRTRLRQQAFLPPSATSCFVSMAGPLTMLCKASYFPAEGLLHNTIGRLVKDQERSITQVARPGRPRASLKTVPDYPQISICGLAA